MSSWYPEGPSTRSLRALVPKTILLMVLGIGNLKYCLLGPSGVVDPARRNASTRSQCRGPHDAAALPGFWLGTHPVPGQQEQYLEARYRTGSGLVSGG